MLRFITTIDFGAVTYEPFIERVVREAGVEIVERVALNQSKKRLAPLTIASNGSARKEFNTLSTRADSLPTVVLCYCRGDAKEA